MLDSAESDVTMRQNPIPCKGTDLGGLVCSNCQTVNIIVARIADLVSDGTCIGVLTHQDQLFGTALR